MITLFGFEPITFFILTIHRQPRLLSIQNISCFAENVITLNTFYLHARFVGVEDYAHLNWVHVDKRWQHGPGLVKVNWELFQNK